LVVPVCSGSGFSRIKGGKMYDLICDKYAIAFCCAVFCFLHLLHKKANMKFSGLNTKKFKVV